MSKQLYEGLPWESKNLRMSKQFYEGLPAPLQVVGVLPEALAESQETVGCTWFSWFTNLMKQSKDHNSKFSALVISFSWSIIFNKPTFLPQDPPPAAQQKRRTTECSRNIGRTCDDKFRAGLKWSCTVRGCSDVAPSNEELGAFGLSLSLPGQTSRI